MIPLLRIGYLASVVILKALPHHDAYLCKFLDSQVLALLPKRWTLRQYLVGETTFAAIHDMNGARVTLSQSSTQYIRKILEYLLASACLEHGLKFKKVARVEGAVYVKAAVEPANGDVRDSRELYRLLQPYLSDIDFSGYLKERVAFVRYSPDLKEYVVNALCPPGPREGILKVIHHEEMGRMTLLIDHRSVGLFVGEKAKNVATARKLCEIDIEIKGVNPEIVEGYYGR